MQFTLKMKPRILSRKLNSGADFFLTQPVFDCIHAKEAIRQMRDSAGNTKINIMVGILPLVTDRHANFLHHEVPGISIPDDTMRRMQKAGATSADTGIKIAVELIQELKDVVEGIYLMPAFNRFDYASEIVETVRKNL